MRQPQLCQGEEPLGLRRVGAGCEESLAAGGCAVSPAASDLCSLARERQERAGRDASARLRAALPAGCRMQGHYTTGIMCGAAASLAVLVQPAGQVAELCVRRAVLERHFWLGSCGDVALVPGGSLSDVTGQRRPRCHGAAGSEGFLDELR